MHVVSLELQNTIEQFKRPDGFTLLEVLVAMTLLVFAVAALASVSAIATRANATAKASTLASLLAAQKLEQLLALTWGYDALGRPLSDTTTDLTVFPPAVGSGVGLSASPLEALAQNTVGYCDFLDASGASLGGGTTPPALAAFVRRWSIVPLPSNPANTLVLQVLVTRVRRTAARPVRALPDEAAFVTIKTRKGT